MGRVKKLSRGDKVVRWIEKYCRIPEGRDVGKPIRLAPFQKKEIRRIYDNEHGTRTAIISFGRKNAKTTLAGCLLLCHTCGPEAKINSQLYSTAQSKEQAAIVFKLAAKIIRLSPELREVTIVRDTIKEIACPELGTLYKALSAEVATSFGLGPSFVIHDELGQVKGPKSDLYDAVETATGTAETPLSIIISTQAPTDSDLLSILIDDAKKGEDPNVVLSLYTAPVDDDPFDPATIRKANPAFDHFMNQKEVLGMAEAARRMPSREADYRNLILNQRVEASSPFVSQVTWRENGGEPDPLEDCDEIYAGLDLSEVNDLTAMVAIGRARKKSGKWSVHPTFWLPEHGLRERSRADRVPYDVWAKGGYLETTPGKSIEYSFVAMFLWRFVAQHKGKKIKIAFDRWNWKHLKPWLKDVGFTPEQLNEEDSRGQKPDPARVVFVEFGQGYASMSPALREAESRLLNGELLHGGHPVLTMCAQNAVVMRDPAGNRKLTKERSRGRIDGLVALTMAAGVSVTEQVVPAAQPEYKLLFLGGR